MTTTIEALKPKRFATPYEMYYIGSKTSLSPQILGAMEAIRLDPSTYGASAFEYAKQLEELPITRGTPFLPKDKVKWTVKPPSRRGLTHFKKILERDHWMRDFLY